MIRTRVGYAGGLKDNPDYHHMGDHTETVQVDYDPQRITYAQLLEIFWQNHDPTSQSWSRQYKHAVFTQDGRQTRLAMESKNELEKKIGRSVKSEVAPLNTFTLAEDYHQKYILKQYAGLNAEMSRIYPNHRELVNSTAVARLNGYASGYGDKDQLAREIDSLGLSGEGRKALIDMVSRKWNYDRQ